MKTLSPARAFWKKAAYPLLLITLLCFGAFLLFFSSRNGGSSPMTRPAMG